MLNKIDHLNSALERKELVKIIAGMGNFDQERVWQIARASAFGNAHAVDIAADPELIKMVKQKIALPIFVSSSDPKRLKDAVEAGADVAELDYDDYYKEKIFPSAQEIFAKAKQTRQFIGDQALLSVTISGALAIDEQVNLAIELSHIGVDILQTEGKVGASAGEKTPRGLLEASLDAMIDTRAVRQAVQIPILASGGISSLTAPYAIVSGADGVGVGSSVSKLNTKCEMIQEIVAIIRGLQELHKKGKTIRC